MTRNSLIRAVAVLGTVLVTVLGALSLSGCASDEMASRILVEPDRYVLYACPELATAWQANMNRQHERKAAADKNCRAMPSATAPGGVNAPARVAPGQ
jgi:hypothetical protein